MKSTFLAVQDIWGIFQKTIDFVENLKMMHVVGVCIPLVQIFHLVEILSVFCLYLHCGLEFFLTKFWSSNPSFNGNILTYLHLKFETSAHAQLGDYSFIAARQGGFIVPYVWET